MKCLSLLIVVVIVCLYSCRGSTTKKDFEEVSEKWPTIAVTILVRNKALTLPYVLTGLEQLDYPKDRIFVWLYMDGSVDDSLDIVEAWSNKHKSQYSNIYVTGDKSKPASGAADGPEWNEERLKHIIDLREKALNFARKRWADYIFMLDADAILTVPSTLKQLVSRKLPIVAPVLLSDGLYSNFWGAMTENFYYKKSEQYEKIINREVIGCFQVPIVHSAVLIDLRTRRSDLLTYNPAKIADYAGPIDDIIAFAYSAKQIGVPLNVCNKEVYGFTTVPVDMSVKKTTETEQFLNVKMEALAMRITIPLDPDLMKFVNYPPKDRLGVDRVFWINLARRSERRRFMETSFKELGVDAQLVKAIDGRILNLEDLSAYSVTLMPDYEDPYHKRPIKAGEVGCFLSHYKIWKEIAARNIKRSLVLEDDVRFTPFFRQRLQELMTELEKFPDWDFVYIGRKILEPEKEEHVSPLLVKPQYSYWTLGYLLSEAGARKLIRSEPCSKMLPVDEFLPIMFGQHPNEVWKSYFAQKDLIAFSASPLLVHPTHYTGEAGYVSDTEDSRVLSADQDDSSSDSDSVSASASASVSASASASVSASADGATKKPL